MADPIELQAWPWPIVAWWYRHQAAEPWLDHRLDRLFALQTTLLEVALTHHRTIDPESFNCTAREADPATMPERENSAVNAERLRQSLAAFGYQY